LAGTGALQFNNLNKEVFYYTNAVKPFIIPHPIKNDKYLVHACLEGPEAGVYYRGVADISDKYTTIHLPSYVKYIASEFTVFITPISNKFINIVSTKIINGSYFIVKGDSCKFNWLVVAKRNHLETEPLKKTSKINNIGPYTYLTK